jgi:hypothetical protein
MNTYSRSNELDDHARAVLAEMGLALETDYVKLRPAVVELQARSGCQNQTARRVIARNIRKQHGLIVRTGGAEYRVVSIGQLPHPEDVEPVPLVLVAEQPA